MLGYPKPTSRAADKRDRSREKLANWLKVRKAVLERDGYRCRACGTTRMVDVHHIKLRSAGGEDSLRNCAALCRIDHDELHAYRLCIIGSDANRKLKFERHR